MSLKKTITFLSKTNPLCFNFLFPCSFLQPSVPWALILLAALEQPTRVTSRFPNLEAWRRAGPDSLSLFAISNFSYTSFKRPHQVSVRLTSRQKFFFLILYFIDKWRLDIDLEIVHKWRHGLMEQITTLSNILDPFGQKLWPKFSLISLLQNVNQNEILSSF